MTENEQAIDHEAIHRHEVALTIDETQFGILAHLLRTRKLAAKRMDREVYRKVVEYCDDQLKLILGLK